MGAGHNIRFHAACPVVLRPVVRRCQVDRRFGNRDTGRYAQYVGARILLPGHEDGTGCRRHCGHVEYAHRDHPVHRCRPTR